MSNQYYSWSSEDSFRFPFEGSENIIGCYGQAMQDIFILSVLKGKRNGTFLEIGCNIPAGCNNTYLLSKSYNWKGISLDFLDFSNEWKNERPEDEFLKADALTTDYESLLKNKFGNLTNIDYLQLDIDPAPNTLSCLKRIPLDKYKFGVITYEHDLYTMGTQYKSEAKEILLKHGYELIVDNVLVNWRGVDDPYEDWWVHPDLVDMTIATEIKNMNTGYPQKFLFT
jgi:hypothetical protein